jgi:hypothetical protein
MVISWIFPLWYFHGSGCREVTAGVSDWRHVPGVPASMPLPKPVRLLGISLSWLQAGSEAEKHRI